MSSLSGTDQQKLEEIAKKPYKAQATWFLNAFWAKHEKDAETVWKQVLKFGQLDPKGKDGHELDELNAHRFLEAFSETHTVKDLRDKLRSKGAIGDKPSKMIGLIHYLAIRHDVDWHKLVNAPQSGGKEVEEASRRLEQAQAACQEAERRASEARRTENEARSREVDAVKREEESVTAKKELEIALAELKKEEDAYNTRTATLKKQSEEGSVVQRNRAANELAQHLAQETLTLRRAKINQEAAVRKADKAAIAASEARKAAEEATREAERAAAAAAKALQEAQKKLAEAEEYLESVKGAMGFGSNWWLERELLEARAYLPQSKGGYRK